MKTSTVVYIPHMTRKATQAWIRDVEYQMMLRFQRKWPGQKEVTVAWRNCRGDPGLWELNVQGDR